MRKKATPGTSEEGRSERKHRLIMDAAMAVFLQKGYDGASMDEIAAKAEVSKQTVYKHFADKERLFSEIILASVGKVDSVMLLVSDKLGATSDLPEDLGELARQLISVLMNPNLLRLRRLVIATSERMPEVGRSWYEQGFERVLATLATCFQRLSEQHLMQVQDPLLAANHFAGLLLWIPVNQAMFTGNDRPRSKAELDRYADAAVQAFLAVYGCKKSTSRASFR